MMSCIIFCGLCIENECYVVVFAHPCQSASIFFDFIDMLRTIFTVFNRQESFPVSKRLQRWERGRVMRSSSLHHQIPAPTHRMRDWW
jgi:hypothetical protein